MWEETPTSNWEHKIPPSVRPHQVAFFAGEKVKERFEWIRMPGNEGKLPEELGGEAGDKLLDIEVPVHILSRLHDKMRVYVNEDLACIMGGDGAFLLCLRRV